MKFSNSGKSLAAGAAILSLSSLIYSCSAEQIEEISSSIASITNLSGLPSSTGEVVASGVVVDHELDEVLAATTGLKLGDLGSTTTNWSSKSRGMCEIGRITRFTYREASEPDKIKCYVGAMVDSGTISTDIYDGNFHYYDIPQAGPQGGGGLKVKMKITRNASNAIQTFEMFSCTGGVQEAYVSKDLTANPVTITAIHKKTHQGNVFAGEVTVSGSVNSSGQWTQKTLTAKVTESFGATGFDGSNNGYAVIEQFPTYIQLTGFESLNFAVTGQFTEQFSKRLFGQIQGIGMNSMSTFALGDGSLQFAVQGTYQPNGQGQQEFNFSDTVSWNGDTFAPLADHTAGDYYTTTAAGTLPNITTQTVDFSEAQTWDCAAPSGGEFESIDLDASFEASATACDTKHAFDAETSGHINCNGADHD